MARVALLDFGIARRGASSQAITGTGVVVGTPAYMAPEQARAEQRAVPAADVFSLGCVLFECLTGEPAFRGEHVMAVLARILFEEPPRLRQLRPEVPRAVEALLARMLAKDPAAACRTRRRSSPRSARSTALKESAATAGERRGVEARRRRHRAAPGQRAHRHARRADTPADRTAHDEEREHARRARSPAQGAHVEMLADGSLVATLLDARGTATDQAARAARCALLIQARWPEAEIALCTGAGASSEGLPIGEVLDRAAVLLRDRVTAPRSRS